MKAAPQAPRRRRNRFTDLQERRDLHAKQAVYMDTPLEKISRRFDSATRRYERMYEDPHASIERMLFETDLCKRFNAGDLFALPYFISVRGAPALTTEWVYKGIQHLRWMVGVHDPGDIRIAPAPVDDDVRKEARGALLAIGRALARVGVGHTRNDRATDAAARDFEAFRPVASAVAKALKAATRSRNPRTTQQLLEELAGEHGVDIEVLQQFERRLAAPKTRPYEAAVQVIAARHGVGKRAIEAARAKLRAKKNSGGNVPDA